MHADHVGSLLRPRKLRDAFRAHGDGELADEDFAAVQDEAIRDVVTLQEGVGLQSITDGEFRRASYWAHVVETIDGLDVAPALFEFTDADGGRMAFRAPLVRAPLRRTRPISLDEYRFLRGATSRTPEITLPSPSTMHFWRGPEAIDAAAYADVDECFADLGAVYDAVATGPPASPRGAAGARRRPPRGGTAPCRPGGRRLPGRHRVPSERRRDLGGARRPGADRRAGHRAPPAAPLDRVDPDAYGVGVSLKVGGLLRLVRATEDRLVPGSRVVALGGHFGSEPEPYATDAGVVNAALANLVRQLADTLGPRGVTVHLLAPGPVDSERLRGLSATAAERRGITVDAVLDEHRAASPLGVLVTAEQVAWAAALLLDPEADALHGATLALDAGTRRGLF